MPDDHVNWIVTYMTDDDYKYAPVTDISDINYGKDMEEDMLTVLNPTT